MLIYIVDDEQAALFYLEKALKEVLPDDEIVTFQRPRKLLEAFCERPADIVFLDIEMPGLNGIELARSLCEIQQKLNIIFVTGFGEYALEALELFASGYILKPCTPEKVKTALERLRYPINTKKDIFIKTFGNFDVYYKGNPVSFRSGKSKEMLAYLVDREGSVVSRQEMAGILFEDDYSRTTQSNLSHLASRLKEDLSAAGIDGLFFINNGYYIDLSVADCDMIDYQKSTGEYSFNEEYMEQYSWGEYKKGTFYR